ncbi:MAG: hypothetical protein ABJG68_16750 [Crocinitomicaceae bacterium]
MRAFIFISILLIALTSVQKSKIKYERIGLLNQQVEINVPADFKVMDDAKMKKSYQEEAMPKVAYSNEEQSIKIGFGSESISSKESGIPVLTIRFEKLLQKLHPKAKWKDKGVQIINGHKVGYIEYINKKPTKFYELLFFTSFKGQLLSCTFHAPKKRYKPWKLVAHEMMQSLTIKK